MGFEYDGKCVTRPAIPKSLALTLQSTWIRMASFIRSVYNIDYVLYIPLLGEPARYISLESDRLTQNRVNLACRDHQTSAMIRVSDFPWPALAALPAQWSDSRERANQASELHAVQVSLARILRRWNITRHNLESRSKLICCQYCNRKFAVAQEVHVIS